MDRCSIATILNLGLLCLILVFAGFSRVSANGEGDALNALRNSLADPNNVLSSWDPTLVNPCTCDLGNANLSGQLVPQLGQLQNLQYLELYSNNISGRIPSELGNLTNLVSLDLYMNSLSGPIPDTLSRLQRLRFLYGDLSNNRLTGPIPVNGSFQLFTPIRFNAILYAFTMNKFTIAVGNSATGAIAGGVAAGAALLFAAPAIALALYRRRKPHDHFFDVPG
ncbi:hypothetical protein DH2020_045215 [Rehmannia glutinosa]|uniref:Leucine-rich repeat-containing N-terminal plant-type domain-containing protein n=1 Tax=Rehmannia glutinosa TaxID=99300 RepID=A0ABR0UES1_REHGL